MEIFTYAGMIALLQVIGIDLVLAGDTVSYTHLDVYKRQPAISVSAMAASFRLQALCSII